MTIFDEIFLRRDGIDSQQWPILNCSQANELALEGSDLRVDADRKILFYDANSSSTPLQITGDGRIIGSLACQSDLSVSGNLGVGTTTPTEKLDVAGKIKATDLDVNGAIATNQLSVTGSVTGSLTVDNGLTVNGAISTNDLSVTGSVTGSLTVENDLTVNGAIATNQLSVTGSVTAPLNIDSDLTVSGAITTNQLRVEDRILRRGQEFSVVGTAQDGEEVSVPWGTIEEWNIFISPRDVPRAGTVDAIQNLHCFATPSQRSNDSWKILFYCAFTRDGKLQSMPGSVNYMLVPR